MLPNPSVSAAKSILAATLQHVRGLHTSTGTRVSYKCNRLICHESRELSRALRSDSLYYNPSRFYSRDMNVRESVFPKFEQIKMFSRKTRDVSKFQLIKSPSRGYFWQKKNVEEEEEGEEWEEWEEHSQGNPELSDLTLAAIEQPFDVGDTEGRVLKLPEGFTADEVIPARLADENAILYNKHRPLEMLLRESGILPSGYLELITRERVLRDAKRIQVYTPRTRAVIKMECDLTEADVRLGKLEFEEDEPFPANDDDFVDDPLLYTHHFPGVPDPDELPTENDFAKYLSTDLVRRPIEDITAYDFDLEWIHKLANPDAIILSRASIWHAWEDQFDQDEIAHVPGFRFFRPAIPPPLLSTADNEKFEDDAEDICDIEALQNPNYVMATPFGWPMSLREDYVDEMTEQKRLVDLLTPKDIDNIIMNPRKQAQSDDPLARLHIEPPKRKPVHMVRPDMNKHLEPKRKRTKMTTYTGSGRSIHDPYDDDDDQPDTPIGEHVPTRPIRPLQLVYNTSPPEPMVLTDTVFKSRLRLFPTPFDSTLVHTLIDEFGIPLYASAAHAELVDHSKLVQLLDIEYTPTPDYIDPGADEFCEEGAALRQEELDEYYAELEKRKYVEPEEGKITDPAIVHTAGGLTRNLIGKLTGTPSMGLLEYAQTRSYQIQNGIEPRDVVHEHFPNLARIDLNDVEPEDRSIVEEDLLEAAHALLDQHRGEGEKIAGYDANQQFFLPEGKFKVYKYYLEDPPPLLYEHPDCRSFMHWHFWPEYKEQYGDRYPILRAHYNLPSPHVYIMRKVWLGYKAAVLAFDDLREMPMRVLDVIETPSLMAPTLKRMGNVVVTEAKHFYHGFRLLWKEAKLSLSLIIEGMKGKHLNRREKKQLARTGGDLLRLVPFIIIILIPFMELALPLILKIFPNMLPSTFRDEKEEIAKARAKIRAKLFVIDVLQDSVGTNTSNLDAKVRSKMTEVDIKLYDKMHMTTETIPRVMLRPNYHGKRRGLVMRLPSFDFNENQAKAIVEIINNLPPIDDINANYSHTSSRVREFDKITQEDDLNTLFDDVQSGERIISQTDLFDLAKLYRGDTCLIKLSKRHLVRVCKQLEVSASGSDNLLRHRISQQSDTLRKDDIVIMKEGTKDMTWEEARDACSERGLRTIGTTLTGMKSTLDGWVEYTAIHNIHASLVILTRILRFRELDGDYDDDEEVDEEDFGVLPLVDPMELVDHEPDFGSEDSVSVETVQGNIVKRNVILKDTEVLEEEVQHQVKAIEGERRKLVAEHTDTPITKIARVKVKREEGEILSPFDGRDLALLTELLSMMAKGDPFSDMRKEQHKLKYDQSSRQDQITKLHVIAKNEEDELNSVLTTLVSPQIIPLANILPDGTIISTPLEGGEPGAMSNAVLIDGKIAEENQKNAPVGSIMEVIDDKNIVIGINPIAEEAKVELPKTEEQPKTQPSTEVQMEEPKKQEVKVEAPKVEAPKVEAPKVETLEIKTPKVEAPKVEATPVDAPKVETPEIEAPEIETCKVEATPVETPKVVLTETPVVDTTSTDASNSTATTTGSSNPQVDVVVDNALDTHVNVPERTTVDATVETVDAEGVVITNTSDKPRAVIDKAMVDLNDAALDLEDNQDEICKVSDLASSLGNMINQLEDDISSMVVQLPNVKVLDSDNDEVLHIHEIKEVIMALPGGHTEVEADILVLKLLSLMHLPGPTIPTDQLHKLAAMFSKMSEDEKISYLTSQTYIMAKQQKIEDKKVETVKEAKEKAEEEEEERVGDEVDEKTPVTKTTTTTTTTSTTVATNANNSNTTSTTTSNTTGTTTNPTNTNTATTSNNTTKSSEQTTTQNKE